MSEIVESESSMARPTWQTSAYDTFLATNQESYPGESSNSEEDFDSGDSHEDEYNLDYVEATYHDRFNYQPDSAHLGVSEIGANKFGLYNSSQQFGDIAEEDFSEEVTSFSAVGPHSVQSESATEPLEQQKVLSPFEELTKEAIKSSTSPSGSPRRSIQPPLVSYDEEGLPIVHILKRSDTAPYFRASSKDSSSNRGSCSVTSERSSRLDPHTYQSYAAGILYSSGRSEKFLKLQKNFDALGRLAQLDEKTPQRKDSFGSQEIATSPKDIQEMYTELQSAQNNKEFFFNASNMSDVQWRRDKDKDLSKSAGVRERLNMYQHALGSTGETTTPQHKKAPSLVGNDMKRCISFGELYSIYDKKNSPKNWSSPTTSLGSLDRSYTQQSYIDIKKKAEKEARQIPIYGTHIGPRENPYEKHVKASVQTLKKTFDPELKKLSASTPDISSRTTRNSSPLEVSQSSLDLSTGRQFSRKTESLSDDEGQLVASSLETLPSYSDALSSRIQRHATAHPGVQEHVAPARGGTNIYEIKVEHLKDTKFLEDDGLHVRSSSAPHQGGPLQIAPTSGTLMRSSSSKDTFFGSELTVKDKFAISYKDMPEPVDLKSKKLYSSGYETHVSVPSSSSLGDGSKGQRSSLLEENPPDDPDTQYKGRTQSKDIFAKHLEANQPRKYSSDSSEKTNNSDDASTARFTWKPRTSQNTTSASKGELTETRAATGKYQSPDISQYEELLVRARRERMARKGYLHSYVNDPESAGFQPYTSITDTDFRFRNAYPSELMGQSRTVPNFQTEVLESEPEALPSRPLRVASSGITSMDTQTTHSFLKADTAGYDKPGTPSVTSYQKSHYNNPDLKQKDQPSADHINSTELTSENGSLGKSRISDWRSEISRKTSHVEREPTSILKKENMPDIVLVDKSIANKPFVGSLKEKTEGPTVYNAGIKYHSPDNRQPIMGTKPVSPDQRQPIIETKPVSHDNRQPIIETKLVSHDNRQPSTGTKPDKATFKVTNLRGLAENNEFANPVLPRMKIPEPSSVGGGFMKPVPHPRVPHSSGPPSSSYSEQHVNHEPPKTLPRKYNSSSANISRDERVNVFNQGASTIHYPADNKTGNITRVNSQEKHSGFKNSSADQQASYRNQYGQLRKWTGVSDINHHQEADSSPSASYSSDGSTGTFIINHSEYDKVKADSPRSATENFQSNPISSSQLREPVQANVYKYQPIKFESKMNTLPSNPQPNVGAGHRPASKTKPSVMQLKNVFEQQSPHSSDLMKPLARAKSAPDLSEHGGAKFDRTPVTVVPRTVSGNLADIRKQFEDNRNESKMYSKGSPLHKSENKLFSRPTSSLNVTSSQSVKSSENVTDNKLIDKRREYGVPEIRSSWLGETNSDVKQYPAPHYDPYIPPDDIYKEVEGIREGRKLDVPRKQNHRPSSVSKMTLEYFDHIGSEWQESGRVSGTKVSGPKDASENTSSVKFTVGSTSQTDDMKLSQGRGTEPPRQEPATHPHKPPPPYTTLFPEPRQPQTTSFRLAQDKTSEALHQAGAIQDKTPDVHITNQYRSNNRFNDLQNNKNIKNGENSFRKINENRPLPKAGNPVVINQGTQPTNQSEKIPGKSQLVSVWVHEQENDQQQPPGLPPPPSDSSISSHLSASQPSLKSPLKSPSTLDRKTNKGLIGGQSSPKEKSTYSSSSAQQSAPTSNSSWNNNTSQKFPRASASKDNLRISSSGQNKENQFSRYASTPSLVDSKQNLSPPLTYAGAKGLIGSYENLYGGTRSSDQTQVPSPPKRQTRANGTSMLESWRQPSRASAAEQLGVKSPPPSSAPKDFRHQTSDVIRKSLPVDEKEKKRKEEDEAYRKKRLEELYEEERKKRVQLDAEKESARRHHDFFTPSQKSPISPNRFEEVPDQRRQTLSPAQQRSPNVQTSKLTTTLSVPPERRRGFQIQGKAKALYNFTAQNPRELSFRKGDVLYLLRQIDKNWFEGEHHGQAGIFPANYVEVITSIEAARVAALDAEGQGRAKYNFTGQSSVELSLRKGEFVTLLRRVDDNWLEGKVGGRQGIFPLSYVEIIREPSTPLITPAPSVITTPMTGTPEMLSPVSIEAPTPPPQPSPSAFSLRSPGMQATYGYKPQPAINRFQYDSQSPADLKSPHEFTVYGQKGVLSPPSSRRGPQDRPRPSDTSAVFPSVNLDISTSSSAMGKPRANKVADDDLTLQRHRAIYAYRPQSEDELELKEGDEVFVMEKCDDGWFVGTSARTGNFGTFPGNYVQKYC